MDCREREIYWNNELLQCIKHLNLRIIGKMCNWMSLWKFIRSFELNELGQKWIVPFLLTSDWLLKLPKGFRKFYSSSRVVSWKYYRFMYFIIIEINVFFLLLFSKKNDWIFEVMAISNKLVQIQHLPTDFDVHLVFSIHGSYSLREISAVWCFKNLLWR